MKVHLHTINYLRKPFKEGSLISNYLHILLKWRYDIRALSEGKNENHLIFWWLKWGINSYPETNVKLGLTLEAESLIKNKQKIPNINSDTDELFNIYNNELNKIKTTFKKPTSSPKNKIIIDLIGYPNRSIGLGEDIRLLYQSINTSKNFNVLKSTKSKILKECDFRIFCLPAPDIFNFSSIYNLKELTGFNIFSMPWELSKWPKPLNFILEISDEIWVHSNFVHNSIPEHFHHKVYKYPQPHFIPPNISSNRPKFKLKKTRKYFLVSFDLASSRSRKNPDAIKQPFIKIKKQYPSVGLILKTNNSNNYKKEIQELKNYFKDVDDVIFITETLEKNELLSLYKSSDCYISPHRSEGFGRNISEMMLLKTPVIVSNYSGNLDFCFKNNSYLIQGKTIPVKDGEYIFTESQSWFDPDQKSIYEQMKNFLDSSVDQINVIKKIAFDTINKKYNLDTTKRFVEDRILSITQESAEHQPPPQSFT